MCCRLWPRRVQDLILSLALRFFGVFDGAVNYKRPLLRVAPASSEICAVGVFAHQDAPVSANVLSLLAAKIRDKCSRDISQASQPEPMPRPRWRCRGAAWSGCRNSSDAEASGGTPTRLPEFSSLGASKAALWQFGFLLASLFCAGPMRFHGKGLACPYETG